MRRHFNIRIHGLVHGVNFRYYACQQAGQLGITGLVSNRTDGTVYIEAEGEEKQLQSFFNWCQNGPRLAKVEKVEVTAGTVVGFEKFIIR